MCSDTFRGNEASVQAAKGWLAPSVLLEGRKHLDFHKHILEICRLTDNFRDGENNRCGNSNLRLNVQNEMLKNPSDYHCLAQRLPSCYVCGYFVRKKRYCGDAVYPGSKFAQNHGRLKPQLVVRKNVPIHAQKYLPTAQGHDLA
jgi:hypothetical protein